MSAQSVSLNHKGEKIVVYNDGSWRYYDAKDDYDVALYRKSALYQEDLEKARKAKEKKAKARKKQSLKKIVVKRKNLATPKVQKRVKINPKKILGLMLKQRIANTITQYPTLLMGR